MTDPRSNEFEAELDGFPRPAKTDRPPPGDALERLASDYVRQVRQGAAGGTEEFAAAHPELADQLQALLPIAQALEQWKTQKEIDCLKQNRPEEFDIRQLGDCEIVREIGRGGMGVVFEAYQGSWKRRVAVKLLPWRFGEMYPRWKERFHEEAKTIAQLRHKNIVPIYTFGEQDGYCYYVMQLVEGVSLDRLIVELSKPPGHQFTEGPGAWPLVKRLARDHWPSFTRLAIQATDALEHAHQQGVLHNDVKPANLLMDAAGQILVTDFCPGQSLPTDLDPAHSQPTSDRIAGTYRFLAPERLSGVSTAQSDVYALGVTLYELFTRTPAFEGQDRTELRERILKGDFVPPRKIRPGIPWALEAIVLKAMAANPQKRYASARQLRVDLLRFLHGQRPLIPRPPLFRRLLAWCGDWLK